ncbi:hypothetical protein CXF83_02340 [Shewanella sp. Choline-02u-19]|jgi:hypothetical protein|uniref:hypothetical protein n=1 Tax=Shewanella TaxID=22 RepID=UPI000C324742|nr:MULTISPECIES: hypothetical protein [Shewanella]MCL1056427.1 hypothetical protein [Shewanella gelidimarina]PKG55141.1 hypothetical protein CXF82_21205 [Shewanella sp. GutDb-MelDb]PKG72898.1 hypothetical protein CXF86_21115 [Shewanella sp. GutCb]PKH58220.1 hypothetical protein CXF84_06195 [Shewanella sp. Bg11-22]PKI29517.1 hypothetical protein CXF83_02340 [Shewanella sp. Choline-02u-19]
MDSIISMDELTEFQESLETRLKRYKACLYEFDKMRYTDTYIVQIREDIVRLEHLISLQT